MEQSATILKDILTKARVIAVVGASPNPSRPSHSVMVYLLEAGYRVFPVRPKVNEILGRPCYASLDEIPEVIDIVDVFRKAEACPDIARSAVDAGARALWLQEGIVSEETRRIAREGGLAVVMDSCTMKVHRQLLAER